MTGREMYRHELKYICTDSQLRLLKTRVSGLLAFDIHAGGQGSYNIRSMYFDDMYNTCFYESVNGTDDREKIRIRIYDKSADRILLEFKKKERGKTRKESCLITKEQYHLLIKGQPPPLLPETSPVLRRFIVLMRTRLFRPRVIVEYERTPYVCPLGNVRVTFDRNISSGYALDDFFAPTPFFRPIMPKGQHVLEVKYDEYLPDSIYHALQINGLRNTAFSKYYLCRKYALGEN